MNRPHRRHRRLHHHFKALVVAAISLALVTIGILSLWIATLDIPDIESFANRRLSESTKIYDRTGTVLLYDTGSNARRTAIPLSEMSPFIGQAAVAIEDKDFYTNIGIEPLSFMRAAIVNLVTGSYTQGGSTITQQVVKNSLLTIKKTPTRKIKEWVLAVKLTRAISKDDILEAYLNENPYGGTMYGVEEASQQFFGRPAKDVTLAEAAYLAAIPQAPTYYSPYGSRRDELTKRQQLVLYRMKDLGMINEEQYQAALAEEVQFLARNTTGIRAPHFVMHIKEHLVSKYGEDEVERGGLRVITTLDYDMQEVAEGVVSRFAPSLAENFGASNVAMSAVDPKTGDILVMVGSRDYFADDIDGNYNVALARRQPGSTFKPFVYAAAFNKGYTPETILWDVETEFSTRCSPDGKPLNPAEDPADVCYSPGEYDNAFPGPMTIRQALAQSRNIPAVQALYLAGINNSISTAAVMGITIVNPDRCGLSLVLGGCEVTLLDLVSAYGVFANDGVRNPTRSILEVRDSTGRVLETATLSPRQALPSDISRQISSILSDRSAMMNSLRALADGIGRQVAIKTGTTNEYVDVWTIGYTPSLVVGAWAGNNDNQPLRQNVAGLIISPLWGAFMAETAKNFPPETFPAAPAPLSDGKPVLRGIWQGGTSYWKDTVSGKVATEYTPVETREEVVFNKVRSILYWVDKDNPRGPQPADPSKDSQFYHWEYAVDKWFQNWKLSNPNFQEVENPVIPTEVDDVHVPANFPTVRVLHPAAGSTIDPRALLTVQLQSSGRYQAQKTEVYFNGRYVTTATSNPLSFSFVPADVGGLAETNTLSVKLYDNVFNSAQATSTFSVTSL